MDRRVAKIEEEAALIFYSLENLKDISFREIPSQPDNQYKPQLRNESSVAKSSEDIFEFEKVTDDGAVEPSAGEFPVHDPEYTITQQGEISEEMEIQKSRDIFEYNFNPPNESDVDASTDHNITILPNPSRPSEEYSIQSQTDRFPSESSQQRELLIVPSQRFKKVTHNVTENEQRIDELDRRIKVYVIDAFESQKSCVENLMDEKRNNCAIRIQHLLAARSFQKVIGIIRRMQVVFSLRDIDMAVVGNCAFNLLDYKTAILWFSDAVVLSDGKMDFSDRCAECYFRLSAMYSQSGNSHQALLHLRKAICTFPNNLAYHQALINKYIEQKNYKDAVLAIEDAVKTSQSDKVVVSNLLHQEAALLENMEMLPEMYECLSKSLQANPSNEAAMDLHHRLLNMQQQLLQDARKLFTIQRYHAARNKVQELIRHNPQHIQGLFLIAKIFRKQNDFWSAVEMLELILRNVNLTDAEKSSSVLYEVVLLLNDCGVEFLSTGNATAAVAVFETAVKIVEKSAMLDVEQIYILKFTMYANYGTAMEKAGNVREAKVMYEKSAEILTLLTQNTFQGTSLSFAGLVRNHRNKLLDAISRVEMKSTHRSRLQQQQIRRLTNYDRRSYGATDAASTSSQKY
ncbi:uncharacterized protein LOC129582050 isoform X2 [Paramacrobiotus metropolitanus]|uniref:uncharacterized protein LOC129582050 isoform X2 n=1 Tax=Paramacrobiotus metropolitanus TaxID=2943436 RepID=UPI0024456680|nr:uncharacterized protein LOC129582050 isoform X2 [Paramacrobiotus metropolitanus]XP_055329415.1 uncharacterized protein LOC129582050 isoform X2 [Paramacrobiotus metropolitanus]